MFGSGVCVRVCEPHGRNSAAGLVVCVSVCACAHARTCISAAWQKLCSVVCVGGERQGDRGGNLTKEGASGKEKGIINPPLS